MTLETVAVTGGNGWIGGAILEDLADHGYETVNVSRGKRREELADRYLRTDLLDPGDVYGSLVQADADALIHMGTINRPDRSPEHTVFESNAMSTYYLLEAAGALGIDRVCLASSINALGAAYQAAPTEVRYLPVDEDHPRTPRDGYAIGKHTMEITADGFGRRPDGPNSIASLRYPWVADMEALRNVFGAEDRSVGAPAMENGSGDRDELFSYLHVDDAVDVARRAIEVDLGTHEIFWAVAGDTSAEAPTEDLIPEYFPDAEVRGSFQDHEGLIDISKAQRRLGWTPERTWRE